MVERTVVTLAFFALFALITLTGHPSELVEGALLAALGQVAASWFGGHQTHQSSARAPAASPAGQNDAA